MISLLAIFAGLGLLLLAAFDGELTFVPGSLLILWGFTGTKN